VGDKEILLLAILGSRFNGAAAARRKLDSDMILIAQIAVILALLSPQRESSC
jgi:hypothetical protein